MSSTGWARMTGRSQWRRPPRKEPTHYVIGRGIRDDDPDHEDQVDHRGQQSTQDHRDQPDPIQGVATGAADSTVPVQKKLSDLNPYQRAREIALRRLDSAQRTRAELMAWMSAREVSEDTAAEVCDELTSLGFIDDEMYARSFIRSQQSTRMLAPAQLWRELIKRGVPKEIVDQVISEISSDQVEADALEIARKKARLSSGIDLAVAQRRMLSQLARKGYSESIARRVTAQALEELMAAEDPDHLDYL